MTEADLQEAEQECWLLLCCKARVAGVQTERKGEWQEKGEEEKKEGREGKRADKERSEGRPYSELSAAGRGKSRGECGAGRRALTGAGGENGGVGRRHSETQIQPKLLKSPASHHQSPALPTVRTHRPPPSLQTVEIFTQVIGRAWQGSSTEAKWPTSREGRCQASSVWQECEVATYMVGWVAAYSGVGRQ